jgi:hypothetical protein
LNKTLPSGVKVVKSLFGNDYTVVNKIDGYEFKTPKAWGGIKEIEYTSQNTVEGYTASSVDLEGSQGGSTVTIINKFFLEEEIDLKNWVQDFSKAFDLREDFLNDTIGKFDVVKTLESKYLFGMHAIFFEKDKIIYRVVNGSEEFIQEIILNGKW